MRTSTGTGAALRAIAGPLDDGLSEDPPRCGVAVTGPSVGRCVSCPPVVARPAGLGEVLAAMTGRE